MKGNEKGAQYNETKSIQQLQYLWKTQQVPKLGTEYFSAISFTIWKYLVNTFN